MSILFTFWTLSFTQNFPTKPWSARFSDVIGASHTSEYRFWEYGGYATEGLKQVAENGITRILESELKNQVRFDHILMNIIKRSLQLNLSTFIEREHKDDH